MERDPEPTVSLPQAASERVLAGRYRIVRRLGVGGMASVHLAEDERLGRPVAVKRLHADSPAEMAQRLEREAKLGASLSHPNLVSVYDTAVDAEGVLVIMEYVDGPTLAEALSEGPLPPERATAIVAQVADALDHAHAAGVVHRDVKPANVLLGDGGAKLADLGIATATEQTQITRSGSVLGTPSYMAPEQLSGSEIGPACDVYALAAVAFEALSGERGRPGRTPLEIAHRVTTEPPPDLREAWPGAPPDAARVLSRAMARDPAERPASAGELASKLSLAVAGGAVDRPSRWGRLGGARALVAGAAVAIVLAAAAAWALPGGADPSAPPPDPAADTGARGDDAKRAKDRNGGGGSDGGGGAAGPVSQPAASPASGASSGSSPDARSEQRPDKPESGGDESPSEQPRDEQDPSQDGGDPSPPVDEGPPDVEQPPPPGGDGTPPPGGGGEPPPDPGGGASGSGDQSSTG